MTHQTNPTTVPEAHITEGTVISCNPQQYITSSGGVQSMKPQTAEALRKLKESLATTASKEFVSQTFQNDPNFFPSMITEVCDGIRSRTIDRNFNSVTKALAGAMDAGTTDIDKLVKIAESAMTSTKPLPFTDHTVTPKVIHKGKLALNPSDSM